MRKTIKKREYGQGTLIKNPKGFYRFQYTDKSFDPPKRKNILLLDENGNTVSNKSVALVLAERFIEEQEKLYRITTKGEAIKRIIETKKLVSEIEKDLSGIWARFEEISVGVIEESTLESYKSVWTKFSCFVNGEHHVDLKTHGITVEMMETFFLSLKKQSVAENTYNRAKTYLGAILKKVLGTHTREWFTNVGAMPKAPPSRNAVTFEEIQAILVLLLPDSGFQIPNKKEFPCFIKLMAFCGMRGEDACHQKWSNIDFDNDTLSYVPIKTRRSRPYPVVIPLHRELRQELLLLRHYRGDQEYILPGLHTRYHQYKGALSKDITRIMQAVGIETSAEADEYTKRATYIVKDPDTGKLITKRRKVCRKSMHSIRHYFATRSKDENIRRELTQEFMVHRSPEMTAHYTHYDMEEKRQAIDMLPALTPEYILNPELDRYTSEEREALLREIQVHLPALSYGVLKAVKKIIDESHTAEQMFRQSRPTIPPVTAENLETVLGYTNLAIGKVFNISGSMVTRYLKKFGLPCKRERMIVQVNDKEVETIRKQLLAEVHIVTNA